MGKLWYTSKTMWVNVFMLVGLVLNAKFGLGIPVEENAEWVVGALGVVNIGLRAITKEAVDWN
jgi:hypothetical protein